MSDTVEVKVRLPKPPEGLRWIAKEIPTHESKMNFWGKSTEWVLALDPAPSVRDDAARFRKALERIATFGNRHGPSDEAEIARAALASNADIDKSGVLMCRQWIKAVPVPCALAKGHKGECRG